MKSVENLENKGIKTLKIENVGFSAVSDVILRHFHLEKATNSSEKPTGQRSSAVWIVLHILIHEVH